MSDPHTSIREKWRNFLFYVHPERDIIPMQARVTLIALYTLTLGSIIAIPFNIYSDISNNNLPMAVTEIIYLSLIFCGVLVFWTSRRLKSIQNIFALGLTILIVGIIFNRGGYRGLGFFYLLAGYSVLYYILGLRFGIAIPIIVLTGAGINIGIGKFHSGSYLNNPDFYIPYLMILSFAAILGVLSVLYQHLLIQKLYQDAYIDETTGLPSRARLEQITIEKIRRQRSSAKSSFSLVGLKIMHFAQVNSFQGSEFADEILKILSQRLASVCKEAEIITRYTGTVFIFICPNVDFLQLEAFGKKVVSVAQTPIMLDERTVSLQGGVSITRCPQDGNTLDRLISNLMANFARMESQTGLVSFFDESQHHAEAKKFALIQELRGAIAHEELFLVFHPKLELSSGTCHGCEVLLRWENRRFGMVGPDVFIQLAEESGLIRDITSWVVNKTIQSVKKLCEELPNFCEHHTFAVNLSPIDLNDSSLQHILEPVSKTPGVRSSQIEFEITEGVMMNENPVVQDNLDYIRKIGSRLAIDDFGTGYSSLSYLHRLKAQNLKIDRSFISPINESAPDAPIVDAIISMARSLEMDITAEGVETAFQEDYLRKRNCTMGQGWLYSKPLKLQDYKQWLLEHNLKERPKAASS